MQATNYMCLYLNPHFNDLERKRQHYKLATYFCPAVNLEPPLDKNEVAILEWGGVSKKRGSRSKQENRMRGGARGSMYMFTVGLIKQTSAPRFFFMSVVLAHLPLLEKWDQLLRKSQKLIS